jgi:hypothetical protein
MPTQKRARTDDPHLQQTASYCAHLRESDPTDALQRILQVLDLLESLHLNLPAFLWAISWNIPEVTANDRVRFAQTTLMHSNELPEILAKWHNPPHGHGLGTQTKAAGKVMTDWVTETVIDIISDEMHGGN